MLTWLMALMTLFGSVESLKAQEIQQILWVQTIGSGRMDPIGAMKTGERANPVAMVNALTSRVQILALEYEIGTTKSVKSSVPPFTSVVLKELF